MEEGWEGERRTRCLGLDLGAGLVGAGISQRGGCCAWFVGWAAVRSMGLRGGGLIAGRRGGWGRAVVFGVRRGRGGRRL